MDFNHSPRALALRQQLEAFMQQYLLPYNAAWHRSVQEGIYPPPFLEDLKALAREAGLWNLFLPGLQEDEPGTRLGHLDYAPLAETMGRLPWAAEVFNCSAPDTGNMELLHRFATPEQRVQWLMPLLEGRIRSAFAMSEPDVASSDPTNLQTTVRRESGQLVINGRKWFITGAAHPNCRLLVVMCRNDEAPGEGDLAGAHHRHSMVLVPLDTPGLQVLRNISVVHHHAPEGHCEILLRDVRVPLDHLLGGWGEGFAMAQARLGPGRVHHCMRTIGQCELALELATERTLERQAFGKYLSDFSNVQEWIAESRIEIDQARLLILHAAWALDEGKDDAAQLRARVAAIKVVAARLQTRVVDRAMQAFGAMGLSPDTPLAYFWTWGRALHLMDGPDEVHLRTVARHELAQAKARAGSTAAYFTTPEQLQAPPRIR
ncbi:MULTISPECIES: acyl-CoA dehydrogenase family protein [unclassified Polaromonas]|jgi:acyl-CoA dehydrogenase|uniref:acyl-CoA dehydrogenase family protein n=1 Tax=unclassified Polaromonas TaxID=2638319 RepID=UPI000BCD97A0|nr:MULTISPECIES: acyl-CoA dehydrogenase family protein [unclassified Polaromonas]OYY39646.1 MAG: acyl-CoA dehydrogenase [Polaromonas sp. 35-63-35]OYZ22390.1 MAG: acyl-CoA dehydrogenase [Polaromonas sp. 16-63-31]OYZ81388.1 MAG: acyl-CoA dehydrogenase [Polaromonas sp. 24-63-21]OZA52385.1 MAG: acyl-CoA dehydrogenase [Polaromonas sp. 17-63-33]OZA88748.1 MAG: acyl-CoA dehydrogenase [Polaromonas sp. 39-63-25]